ncbi:hypothetical protein M0804_012251 [Polistes exclamans]|nr:hypothetical protein M0804_012251 [Polistes exclamans]
MCFIEGNKENRSTNCKQASKHRYRVSLLANADKVHKARKGLNENPRSDSKPWPRISLGLRYATVKLSTVKYTREKGSR